MEAEIAQKSAQAMPDVRTPHVRKSPNIGRDFIVTSLAAVEAVREDAGWSVALLCRVSDISDMHYRRVRRGVSPLTDGTLAKLGDGIRKLQANGLLMDAPPPRVIEQGPEYAIIAKGLQRRRMELGLTCEQVDWLTGFHGGYTAKLENWDEPTGRGFGELSCRLWCQALGVEIAVIEGVVPVATRAMINPIGPTELARRYDSNRKRLEVKQRTMAAKREARGASA